MTNRAKVEGKLGLGMRCAECLHFKDGPKSPHYKARCHELGRQSYSKACQYFTPNFMALNRDSGALDAAAQIAKISRVFNDSQMRVLGMILAKQGALFEKAGYKFGQPMYLYLDPATGLTRHGRNLLEGNDTHYLEFYYKAYIVGIQKIEKNLYELYLASSVEGKPDWSISVRMTEGRREYVLTRSEFKLRQQELRDQGKLRAPKKVRKMIERAWNMNLPSRDFDDYEVPTIDNVPQEWFDTRPTDEQEVALSKRSRGKAKEEPFHKAKPNGSGKKKKKKKVESVTLDLSGSNSQSTKLTAFSITGSMSATGSVSLNSRNSSLSGLKPTKSLL